MPRVIGVIRLVKLDLDGHEVFCGPLVKTISVYRLGDLWKNYLD